MLLQLDRLRSPSSAPALLWFGVLFCRVRTGLRGAGGRRCRHICFLLASKATGVPHLLCLFTRMFLFSPGPLTSLFSLNSLGSLGFEFSPFVMFCSLLPITLPLPQPSADSHLHSGPDTQSAEAVICSQLQKRKKAMCDQGIFVSLAGGGRGNGGAHSSSLSSSGARNSFPAER